MPCAPYGRRERDRLKSGVERLDKIGSFLLYYNPNLQGQKGRRRAEKWKDISIRLSRSVRLTAREYATSYLCRAVLSAVNTAIIPIPGRGAERLIRRGRYATKLSNIKIISGEGGRHRLGRRAAPSDRFRHGAVFPPQGKGNSHRGGHFGLYVRPRRPRLRGKAQKAARGHRSGTARHKAHRPRSPQGPYGQGKRPHLGLCAVFERQRRADMDQARFSCPGLRTTTGR